MSALEFEVSEVKKMLKKAESFVVAQSLNLSDNLIFYSEVFQMITSVSYDGIKQKMYYCLSQTYQSLF